MSKPALVTIAISTKDQLDAFTKTLESAQQQTYTPLEILVVDHASQDATKPLLKHLEKQDPRIRVIRHSVSITGTASYHEILQEYRGDYLCFLALDDRLEPEFIEKAMADFAEFPKAGFWYCHSKLRNSPEGQVQLPHRAPRQEAGLSFLYHRLATHNRGAFLSACVFKREILAPITPFLETTNLFELSLLIYSAFQRDVIYEPKALHHHFYQDDEIGDRYTGRQYSQACIHLMKYLDKTMTFNPQEKQWLKKCLSYHAMRQLVHISAKNEYDFLERMRVMKVYTRSFFPYVMTNFFTYSTQQAGQYALQVLQVMNLWKQPKILRKFVIAEQEQRPNEKLEDYHKRLVEEMMMSVLKAMANDIDIHLWGERHVVFAGKHFAGILNAQFQERGLKTGEVVAQGEVPLSTPEIEYITELVDEILKTQWLRQMTQKELLATASKLRK